MNDDHVTDGELYFEEFHGITYFTSFYPGPPCVVTKKNCPCYGLHLLLVYDNIDSSVLLSMMIYCL